MALCRALLQSTVSKFHGHFSHRAVSCNFSTCNLLSTVYQETIIPFLAEEFNYKNSQQIPKVEKVVVKCSTGDSKGLEAAIPVHDLTLITGQMPKKSKILNAMANFRSKEAVPRGIGVTLRGDAMFSFLNRLMNLGIPRMREIGGVTSDTFDGCGNYRISFREQTLFPEIGQDMLGSKPRGLDVVIKTTAATDTEAYKLLALMGMPFAEGFTGPSTIVRKKKLKLRYDPKSKSRQQKSKKK